MTRPALSPAGDPAEGVEQVELAEGYGELLEQVKDQVRSARVRAARLVNTGLVGLYWRIGRLILDRQDAQGWGTGVTGRLAADLRAEFPTMRGRSPRNLAYMRAFAAAFPADAGRADGADVDADSPDGAAIVQQAVAQLPWGHVTVLLASSTTRSSASSMRVGRRRTGGRGRSVTTTAS